jgi:hypothetical protein
MPDIKGYLLDQVPMVPKKEKQVKFEWNVSELLLQISRNWV